MPEPRRHIQEARDAVDRAERLLIGDGKPVEANDLTGRDLSDALAELRTAAAQIIEAQIARALEDPA